VLQVGDTIIGSAGEQLTIRKVTPTGKEEDVYNFEVDGGMGYLTPMTAAGSKLLTTTTPLSGQNIGQPDVTSRPYSREPGLRVLHAPAIPRVPAPHAKFKGVLLVTYTGDIATCGARHPIAKVGDPFETIIANEKYQAHLVSRAAGRHNDSPWCRDCERMI
jgi:hypothetical protein